MDKDAEKVEQQQRQWIETRARLGIVQGHAHLFVAGLARQRKYVPGSLNGSYDDLIDYLESAEKLAQTLVGQLTTLLED